MNGSPLVDYDPAIWLQIPPFWGPQTWPDHRAWARGMAEAVWKDSGERPGQYQVENLALGLAMCAERFGPDEEDGPWDTFVHLPGPRADLLPVSLYLEREAREDELRAILVADHPTLIDGSLTEFTTSGLGTGLRHLFHQRLPEQERDEGSGISIHVLRFAWWLPEPELALVLTATAEQPELITAAEADIDNLARTINWEQIPGE